MIENTKRMMRLEVMAWVGYGIVLIYGIMLIGIGLQIKIRYPRNQRKIHEYLFAGNHASFGLLAPSIFTSWIWVTSIVGSGEAGFRFGIIGGLSYSIGAGIAFGIFIFFLVKLKLLMPEGMFVTDYIGLRFSGFLKDAYYFFGMLVIIYVIVEQSAGIGLVFNGLFQVSFKKIAFFTVILCGIYVVWRGMRGVLFNELANFFLISIGFLCFVFMILKAFPINTLYHGLESVATDSYNRNYNPDGMNLLSKSGILYGISAIVIAMGQILMDPAYYLKAHISKNKKVFVKSFLWGGVIFWMPVSILSSFVIGYVSLSQNIDLSQSVNLSIDISTNVLNNYFGLKTKILFACLVFCIGCTSIIHCLIGIQSLYTIDFYKNKINPAASENEKMRFGKVVTLLTALLCALISLSLQKVSLLTIDVFSGIFLAAPCGVVLIGIVSKKVVGNFPWIAIVVGISSGLWVWLQNPNQNWNFFLGIMSSFFLPVILVGVKSLFSKQKFNFKKLLFLKSE